MAKRIKGYTRADGTKVKGHKRKGATSKRTYTAAERRAFKKSQTSRSGHKSWRDRQKEKRPGLWANVHAKHHREGK